MPSKIRVLSDTIINQIAAGEVIESVASVVKELVENALDAGATEITIEIKSGGRYLIRISDSGCGMSRDDALLCLERHATSKIRAFDDLHSLNTMGFRGEAIPSIASISKFTLITSESEDAQNPQATMVLVDGGRIVQCESSVRTRGTTVEVKTLFFNVPVRKKFQKPPSHDVTDIHRVVSAFALGYPHIAFELISDAKVVLKTTSKQDEDQQQLLGSRLQEILGAEFASSSVPIAIEDEGYKLMGFIGKPVYHRSNRMGQHLFLNRRHIYSPLVSAAMRDGYGTSLPPNRFPCFLLHLTIPGDLVDVNVHPQKREVRFSQGHLLQELIHRAVRQSLIGGTTSATLPQEGVLPALLPWEVGESVPASNVEEPSPVSSDQPAFASTSYEKPTFMQQRPVNFAPMQQELSPLLSVTQSFRQPRILAVMPRYILVDASSIQKHDEMSYDGLYVVDQYVAHFRVLYEQFSQRAMVPQGTEDAQEVQSLLIPYTIEFSASEAMIARQHLKQLQSVGIGIQEFGQNAFIVDAIPQQLAKEDIQEVLKNLISEMQVCEDSRLPSHEREKRLVQATSRSLMAKRNQQLSIDAAQYLMNKLMRCQQPYQCPMGKPTMVRMTSQDLAKQFF
jgi:DNA mismatch repair protein MutL